MRIWRLMCSRGTRVIHICGTSSVLELQVESVVWPLILWMLWKQECRPRKLSLPARDWEICGICPRLKDQFRINIMRNVHQMHQEIANLKSKKLGTLTFYLPWSMYIEMKECGLLLKEFFQGCALMYHQPLSHGVLTKFLRVSLTNIPKIDDKNIMNI